VKERRAENMMPCRSDSEVSEVSEMDPLSTSCLPSHVAEEEEEEELKPFTQPNLHHTPHFFAFFVPPNMTSTSGSSSLLDPSIFDYLKSKLDEETEVKDTLNTIVQRLERAVASAQAILSRVHSTPRARCKRGHTHTASLPRLLMRC
jgi:hypothetical protein